MANDDRQQPVPATALPAVVPATLLTADDLYLFNEGSHHSLYRCLGAHPGVLNDSPGTHFAVWAPDAERVSVIGDFNEWSAGAHPLAPQGSSGIWTGFIPNIGHGTLYKFRVDSRYNGYSVEKADPFATHTETPPRTGSIIWDLVYTWGDAEWMAGRAAHNAGSAPWSIYEVHLGSWMRVADGNRWLSYREVAPRLAEYVRAAGFTHVELLPIMEHPFYGSWGYQTTGYFAPTSRYGTPQDFMFLVDTLHQHGIGVILDWVPSHFPDDEFGLSYFDGTHLYEHADPRQGFHPDWKSLIFNYSRNEVRSFLLSSALFWLDVYHADGLRVDAVASMLYLDYSRDTGEWLANRFGGRENLEAIEFLRRLNSAAYGVYPDIQIIAEESTAWPMVSRPTYLGGLGFGMKWDMGWMHDTLSFIAHDPVHRRFHHNELTFRTLYAFTENFVLPLSHDEVVHGKGSLLGRMPGDDWQQFANLRLLFGYLQATPGKKLLFMGGEFGQRREWDHESSIDWHLLEHASHAGILRWVSDLNRVLREQPALHQFDFDDAGFRWIDANDSDNSVLSFLRYGVDGSRPILVLLNFTPVVREGYRVGVPRAGQWQELLNSDASEYWGSGIGNAGAVETTNTPSHGQPCSLHVRLPPLAALFLLAPADEDAQVSAGTAPP